MGDEEFGQFKTDIGELKVNVTVIKDEIHEMKVSITNSIEKISNSMTVLATVSEKLHQNHEDHKLIHTRIDNTETKFKEYYKSIEDRFEEDEDNLDKVRTDLIVLNSSHTQCILEKARIQADADNSIWKKTKNRFVEYIFIVIMCLTVYVLFSHFKEFISYMNTWGVSPF
jgi:chromosome segregation ATPase